MLACLVGEQMVFASCSALIVLQHQAGRVQAEEQKKQQALQKLRQHSQANGVTQLNVT